jgi:hypothetical protein
LAIFFSDAGFASSFYRLATMARVSQITMQERTSILLQAAKEKAPPKRGADQPLRLFNAGQNSGRAHIDVRAKSGFGGKADIRQASRNRRF